MAELRLPQITGRTEKEQLEQMKTYMFQLTRDLNFALKDVKASETQYQQSSQGGGENSLQTIVAQESAKATFNRLKDLIIKSADIIAAYSEEINKKLKGIYVAESDFGTYLENNLAEYNITPEFAQQTLDSVKEIKDSVDGLDALRKDSCYIKIGWLDDGKTIGGVEVGQYSETDGQIQDSGFARLTTKGLIFYDGDGIAEENILAMFADYRSYIRNAQFVGNIELDNGYLIDTSDGIAFKWAGDD